MSGHPGPFGGPMAGARRTFEPMRPVKGMTDKRLNVLNTIEQYATREKPLRLAGQNGRAARWLAVRGYVVTVYDGAFAPVDPSIRPPTHKTAR